MAEFKNQDLIGTITLDGGRFINVDFRNATLVYSGGEAPYIEACRFHDAAFRFEGPASNTLTFLNIMAPRSTNMRSVVEGLLPGLKA